MSKQRQEALTKALEDWSTPTDTVVFDYGECATGPYDCYLRVLHRPIATDREELVIQRFVWMDYAKRWECSVDYQQEVKS